jgi:hypothetical protein
MRIIRTILLTLAAIAAVHFVRAANDDPAKANPPAPARATSYLADISISPYAAVTHRNITDESSFGAGLDLGLAINKFVSIHGTALGYSDNDWRGGAIDEAGVYAKARLVRNANETLSLYGIGGADRDFATEDWALGIGLGVELRLHKNVSLFGDSRVRAWFREGRSEDLQTRAGINLSF